VALPFPGPDARWPARSAECSSPGREFRPSTCTATAAKRPHPEPGVVFLRRGRVIVATDIAARGIHVNGILVIHADSPAEPKACVHWAVRRSA